MKVNEALKRFRKKFKLRQQDVADFLQINRKTYQLYEYGRVNIPVGSIIKLADKFNMSTDYLLGRTDEIVSDIRLINVVKTCYEISKPIVEEINGRKK